MTDALGSTLGLVNSSGTIAASYTYQPFGKSTQSGSASTAFQFTGRENDGTGLNYYRARYYSPLNQRFVAQDPFGQVTGAASLYDYTRNNPLTFSDPFGLYTCFYSQSEHRLICYPDNPFDPLVAPTAGVTTSGTGRCRDNPTSQNVHDHGPIPQGGWNIGPTDWGNGTPWIPLSPMPGTNTFGRTRFNAHGCANMATCSTGCIGIHDNGQRDLLGTALGNEPGSRLGVYP